jgi:hypothetical protein
VCRGCRKEKNSKKRKAARVDDGAEGGSREKAAKKKEKRRKKMCNACGRCPSEIRLVNRRMGNMIMQQQQEVPSKGAVVALCLLSVHLSSVRHVCCAACMFTKALTC